MFRYSGRSAWWRLLHTPVNLRGFFMGVMFVLVLYRLLLRTFGGH